MIWFIMIWTSVLFIIFQTVNLIRGQGKYQKKILQEKKWY